MNRLGIFSFIFVFLFCTFLTNASTVFYIARGDQVIAGSNEDSDTQRSQMAIFPPSGDKNGWIKFSFSDGYPQGGMNQHGLFWDASSAPYRSMPVCVNSKELYDGCLMKKVMEECKTIEDVIKIFENCYCNEMFDMQLMIGDENGQSLIIAGDEIIHNEDDYQVLTNFYESDPDLGGYPCWRYEALLASQNRPC